MIALAFHLAIQVSDLPERDVVAYTLWAESRGEGTAGMKAVAGVIANRAKLKRKPLSKVCLEPWQFSCWNGVKTVAVPNDKTYRECQLIATAAMAGRIRNQFTHYYAPKSCHPSWAESMAGRRKIGNHVFGTIGGANKNPGSVTVNKRVPTRNSSDGRPS